MRVLLCSDTHKNLQLFQRVLDFAQEVECDTVWHLGDWYDDVQNAETYSMICHQVPGLWHPHYRSSFTPNMYTRGFKSVDCTLIHDLHAYHTLSKVTKPQIVCHGHTHHPALKIEKEHRLLTLNPGHLKHPSDRGYDATFMILNIDESPYFSLTVDHYTHTCEKLSSVRIDADQKGFSGALLDGEFYGKISL